MAERPVSGVAKVETKPPQELETVEPTATTDTDNSVPKGRQQHLAKREDLAVFSSEGEEEQVGNPSSQAQVFELSVAEPLPLIQRKDSDLYTALIFLFFLLSGAGKKYMEYVKEL